MGVRIAGRGGFDQGIEIAEQRRIELSGSLPTAPALARAPRRQRQVRLEFAQAALNRRPRNPRGPLDQADAAMPERARFGGRPQPPRALGKHRRQRRMFGAERGQSHASPYNAPGKSTNQINQLFLYKPLGLTSCSTAIGPSRFVMSVRTSAVYSRELHEQTTLPRR